jgi:hypothetical protein
MTGAESHYANGHLMRDFFESSGNFLSLDYSPDEVYIQTSAK